MREKTLGNTNLVASCHTKRKILTPIQILHAIRYVPGDVQTCTLLRLLLYCWHGNAECLLVAPNLNFHPETVVKSAKCIVLFLQPIETLRRKTWSTHNTIILVHTHHVHVSCFYMFNYLKFERHKRSINYLESWPFELMVKIRLLFLEFLQKYIGSRGRTKQAVYTDVLVNKSVKITAGKAILFLWAVKEQTSNINFGIFRRD